MRTQAWSELDRRHGGRGHDADGRLSTLAGRCDRGELKLAANVDCGARVTRMCGVAHECVTRCGESIWPPHNSPNRASDATTRISYALLVVVIRIRSPVRRSSSRSRSMIFRLRKKVPSLLRATSVGISCQVGRGLFSPMRVDCTRAPARLAGLDSLDARDRFASCPAAPQRTGEQRCFRRRTRTADPHSSSLTAAFGTRVCVPPSRQRLLPAHFVRSIVRTR